MDFTYERIQALLPKRDVNAHKGNFGRLLLLCGSRGFTGAAYLAAMGALRTGAGLVFLGVPESIYAIEAVKLNEAVVFPLPDREGKLAREALPEILERLPQMDALLLGPGLGQSEDTVFLTKTLLQKAQCPVVLDADGINCIAPHKHILRSRIAPTVLTPHDGEFRRMHPLTADRVSSAKTLAQETGCIVLLKGHETLITDGNTLYRNHTGNPGMAVGGSGDLLAGIIVSLIGQGIAPLEAAAAGAWLHGSAGDEGAKQLGQMALLPTDMLSFLPRLLI